MADTASAAFFAKKKKKKKAFKGFNANKIDVESVTQTVHVYVFLNILLLLLRMACFNLTISLFILCFSDAPALSEESTAILESAASGTSLSTPDASQWDEQQLPSKTSVICKDKEILDVKTLSDATEEASNSIQERLKLEETKAALQAARDGMEREAQRLKEQEENKGTTEPASGSGRFSAAAQNVSASGEGGGAGKSWVPPHLRAGTAASLTRRAGGGGGMSSFQKVDTKDETLFPDLNTADKILEQEKKAEAYKPPKKTPGSWAAARASGTLKKPAAAPAPVPKVEEPVVSTKEEEAPKPDPLPVPVVDPPAPTPTKSMPVKKKKKKKDLSTFKPSA